MYLFSIHVFDRHLHYTPFKGDTTQIEIGGDGAIFPFGFLEKVIMSRNTFLLAFKHFYNFPMLNLYRVCGKIEVDYYKQPDHVTPLFQPQVS